jgi:2-polyprenyl-6-methoxyphenol hydroxylase-like FAD-dependent oxidoreductase
MSRIVVIAGGGPTGLMLACELGLAGVPVVVLDPRTDRPERSAGMAVHGRTLELFAKRGLRERIRDEDMFAWPRTPFAFLWLDLGTVDERDHTYAYPQWRTERLLAERATELGADLRWGHRVLDAVQDSEAVTVTVRGPEGDYELSGAFLVGCDGADSRVREVAGIGTKTMGLTHHGVLGDLPVRDGDDGLFDVALRPEGMFGALPLEPGTARLMSIEFGVDPPDASVPVTTEELLKSARRTSGRDLRFEEEAIFLARFGGPTRLAERYRSGRIFLAGDAAHSLFISGTQGLNTGIHDAANLGWKLAAEIGGWAPPGLLDTYHAERHPVGERVCTHASASTALLHPLQHVEPLREVLTELLAYPAVHRHLLLMTTQVRYPLPTDGADEDSLTGYPAPDPVLSTGNGRRHLSELLATGRGLLLYLTGASAERPASVPVPAHVDVVVADATPELAAEAVLIRPDGHIAYAGSADPDGGPLRAALATWFGG